MLQDVITLLLFVVPGAMTMLIRDCILGADEEPGSDLDKTVGCFACSLPISLVSWSIVKGIDLYRVKKIGLESLKVNTLAEYSSLLTSWAWMSGVFVLSCALGVVAGLLLASQRQKSSVWLAFVNGIRTRQKRPVLSGEPSIWQEIASLPKATAVSVHDLTGAEAVRGFLIRTSEGTQRLEMIIGRFNVLKKFDGYIEDLDKVYVDLTSGIMVKFYKMDEYNEYCAKYPDDPPAS